MLQSVVDGGLEFMGKKSDVNQYDGTNQEFISLPKEYILQRTMTIGNKDNDGAGDGDEMNDFCDEWDVLLSMKLLKECQLYREGWR